MCIYIQLVEKPFNKGLLPCGHAVSFHSSSTQLDRAKDTKLQWRREFCSPIASIPPEKVHTFNH